MGNAKNKSSRHLSKNKNGNVRIGHITSSREHITSSSEAVLPQSPTEEESIFLSGPDEEMDIEDAIVASLSMVLVSIFDAISGD